MKDSVLDPPVVSFLLENEQECVTMSVLTLTDGRSRMLMLDNEADARKALALAIRHTHHCFGRFQAVIGYRFRQCLLIGAPKKPKSSQKICDPKCVS